MKAFQCQNCDRISYSASSDTSAPCIYCNVGRIEMVDDAPSARDDPIRTRPHVAQEGSN